MRAPQKADIYFVPNVTKGTKRGTCSEENISGKLQRLTMKHVIFQKLRSRHVFQGITKIIVTFKLYF